MKPITFFIACLFTASLHAQNKTDISAEKQQLLNVLDDWARKGATGNLDSTMYYWADDAIILDRGKNINGKSAIRQMMQGMANVPGFKMNWDAKPVTLEVAQSGDMAYIVLQNTMSIPDSTVKISNIRNTALEAWKKDKNGTWKCAIVMMTPDEAAMKQ